MSRQDQYAAAIDLCVEQAVREKMTTEQVFEPLIKQLAKVAVATARTQGFKPEYLVEIIRHELDQKVVDYDQINPR